MPGPIHRKMPAPVLQAIILRRDLRLNTRQVLACASEAALAFIVAQARVGLPISLTAEEMAWLCGAQAKLHLRAYSEAALNKVTEHATRVGLRVHLVELERVVKEQKQSVVVCCAIGPASAAQIASITGQLTVW